jgi:beta-glucosidase
VRRSLVDDQAASPEWSTDDFVWAIGEEGSDPVVMSDGVAVRQDQFAQSGHIQHRFRDLADIASLGATHVRYGVPWRLTEVEPGTYDWTGWDEALGACHQAGLVPIMDLIHFGLPSHCGAGGFGAADWLDPFCRYTDALLSRYGADLTLLTPVNEPGITALASGRFGIWNERGSSAQQWIDALGRIVLANLEAISRMRATNNGWWIGSEGIDINAERIALGDLVWDLHFGVDPVGRAADLVEHMSDDIRSRIDSLSLNGSTQARSRDRVVAGHDVYPASLGAPDETDIAALLLRYRQEARRFHARYGVPIWVAETSNLGLPVEAQSRWLDLLVESLQTLRADGVPMVGLCWYSRGNQFDWQTMLAEPTGSVTTVGLYDTERVARPVTERFRRLAGAALI